MEKYDLQKLRELPIEQVAERLGLRVTRHRALCPFHDDSNPSLSFSVSRNTYRCWVCGASGGTIDLAMGILGVGFLDACRWLADAHNVIVEERQPARRPARQYPPDVEWLGSLVARPVLCAEARRFLYDERHYDPRWVEWLGISSITSPTPCWRHGSPYYDAPSLLFPYRDEEGRLVNVQSRYLGPRGSVRPDGTPIPRFRFPRGCDCHVFNLPILRHVQPGAPLFITEGITDCLALLSSGHPAIAIPSATLLKDSDLQPLARRGLLNWHIFPDQDEAGEHLYRQLLSSATSHGACLTRHTLPTGVKDYSDFYLQKG